MLPPCFKPTDECALALARVHEGLAIDHDALVHYVETGLIRFVPSPTGGYGYELTEDGETALGRYVYASLAGRRA